MYRRNIEGVQITKFFPRKSDTYYVCWVCCRLSYPACKVYAPYYAGWAKSRHKV